MLLMGLLAYLAGIGFICFIGWRWQASKSPEQQHLELLIDLDDPGVTAYATKLWGPPPVTIDFNTGRFQVLI